MKPADILPDDVNAKEVDGMVLRKGSVAAFIANAKILTGSATNEAQKREAKDDLISLVPVLKKLGVFDVFSIRDPKIQSLVDEA